MRFEDALQEFEKFLASQAMQVKDLTPSSGIAALISFYRSKRVDGCSLEEDDMLLYEFYELRGDEFFELGITRQLTSNSGNDSDIWQLSLSLKFDATDSLLDLDSESEWCSSLQQLDEFEEYIYKSAAFQDLSQSKPNEVALGYFCTG